MNHVLICAAAFALGDYLALTQQVSIYLWLLLMGLGAFGAAAGHWLVKIKEVLFLFCLFFLLGAGALLGYQAKGSQQQITANLYGRERMFRGYIVPGTVKIKQHGCLSFTMYWENTPYKIKVSIPKWPKARKIPFYGNVLLKGTVRPIKGFGNPGIPSQELMAKTRNEIGNLSVLPKNLRLEPGEKSLWYYGALLSKKMQKILSENMSPKDSGLLAGMVLGEKSNIDSDVLKEFSATGLIHLLAVSGTHVAILMGFAVFLLKKLGLSGKKCILPASLLLIGYVLLCGPRPSILRAVLMGMALLIGKALDRQEDTTAVWSGALILLLAFRPWWILDLGFQLSFLATGGLLWLFAPIEKFLKKYLPDKIAGLLAVSLAAQLLMVPLLVEHFHQLSLVSPLANLLVVPILSIVLTITMLGLLVSLFLPLVGKLFLVTASQLLGVALFPVKILGDLSLATWTIGKIPGLLWLVYYVCLGVIFKFWPFTNFTREKTKIVLISCVLVFFVGWGGMLFWPKPFKVYFLDVGQGDCALVLTPKGESIMVDTGGLPGNFDIGERIVLPVLRYLGINKLDVLILSHGHHDHAGGAAAIAKAIPIGKILVPEEKNSRDFDRLWQVVKSQKIVYKIQTNEIFNLKDCIIYIVKAPDYREEHTEGNERSAVVQISHKGKSILFTGDATEEIEMSTLGKQIGSTVLKLSHHGSKSSSATEFLQEVNPQLTVISVGRNNKFGHPHREVLERLRKLELPYVRTDLEGAIKVVFDEKKLSCYSYFKQPNYF
jgi:competence protein ComEC